MKNAQKMVCFFIIHTFVLIIFNVEAYDIYQIVLFIGKKVAVVLPLKDHIKLNDFVETNLCLYTQTVFIF